MSEIFPVSRETLKELLTEKKSRMRTLRKIGAQHSNTLKIYLIYNFIPLTIDVLNNDLCTDFPVGLPFNSYKRKVLRKINVNFPI